MRRIDGIYLHSGKVSRSLNRKEVSIYRQSTDEEFPIEMVAVCLKKAIYISNALLSRR